MHGLDGKMRGMALCGKHGGALLGMCTICSCVGTTDVVSERPRSESFAQAKALL